MTTEPSETRRPFFVAGGTVPPGSPSYVERAADRELFEALMAGEFCHVLNSRQMGKSSLAVRTIAKLNDAGVRTAFVDLTRVGGATVSPEQWYAGLLLETGRALGLRAEAAAWLKDHRDMGPAQRLLSFLHEAVLARVEGPVVLMVDEIDAVRSLPFSTDELFAGVRQLHNGRASDPALRRLTVCLLGAALPSDLIRDPRVTPFNVGRRIELRDFTAEEARPFAEAVGGDRALARLLGWTGGHPFLTQALGAELAGGGDVDALVRERYLDARAREADTNLADVGRRLLGTGDPNITNEDRATTLALYERMLKGKPVLDDESNPHAARIKMSGVARVENGLLKPRNRIYEAAFDRRWVRESTPDHELRRQRRAFWRGTLRTGAVAAVVIVSLGATAWVAISNARLARESDKKARAALAEARRALNEAYASGLGAAAYALHQGELRPVAATLRTLRDQARRGWEFGVIEKAFYNAERSFRLPAPSVRVRFIGRVPVVGCADGTVVVQGPDRRAAVLLRGTSSPIHALAVAPDQKALVVGWADGNVLCFDLPQRRVRWRRRLTSGPESAVFSPDGLRIGIAGGDGAVVIVLAENGHGLLRRAVGRKGLRDVAFSPDGRVIAASGDDGDRALLDARLGTILWSRPAPLGFHNYNGTAASFSADGATVAFADVNSLLLLDVRTRSSRTLTGGTMAGPWGLCESPDGRSWRETLNDGSVVRIDARSGETTDSRSDHPYGRSDLAFSEDRSTLATVGTDRVARISSERPPVSSTVVGGLRVVLSSALSPDGRLLLTSSQGGEIRLTDLRTKRVVWRTFEGDEVCRVSYAPDGQSVAIFPYGYRLGVRVRSARDGSLQKRLPGGFFGEYSPNGERLVVCDSDGARVYDAHTLEARGGIKGLGRTITAAFSPDGRWLATAADTGTRVYKVASLALELNVSGPHGLNFAFSQDGKYLATDAGEGSMQMIDLASKRTLWNTPDGLEGANWIGFTPDQKRLVTCGGDGRLRVWDAAQGDLLVAMPVGHGGQQHGAFTREGRLFVSCRDGSVQSYDPISAREEEALKRWEVEVGSR